MIEILAVSVNTLIDRKDNLSITEMFRRHDYLKIGEVEDSFKVLRELAEKRFGEAQVFLVFECKREICGKILKWLSTRNIHNRTKIRRGRIRRCQNISRLAKTCMNLGVTHLIDNNLELFTRLPLERGYLLIPGQRRKEKLLALNVWQVGTWPTILHDLTYR